MFTGIIEELGTVARLERSAEAATLTVRAPVAASDASLGDSICVDGVCLSVTEIDHETDALSFDVMGETLDRSALGGLQRGDRVNVERAMRPDARLGGHIVQGHVDAIGTVRERTSHPGWDVLRIEVPGAVGALLAEKGSVAVSGISLTVSALADATADLQWFEVSLIPETLARTTLGGLAPGALVNVETDIVARHIARLVEFARGIPSADDVKELA